MSDLTCSIDGCDRPAKTRQLCGAHYERQRRHGDVGAAAIGRGAREKANHWHGENVSYFGAHSRLKRERGRAADHSCQHCSRSALHWAYDHVDPHEKVSSFGAPFSLDPAHYMPLCASCHKLFDLALKVS